MPKKKSHEVKPESALPDIEIPVDVALDISPDPGTPVPTTPEPATTVLVFAREGSAYVVRQYDVPSSALCTPPTWQRPKDTFDGALAALEMHLAKRFSK